MRGKENIAFSSRKLGFNTAQVEKPSWVVVLPSLALTVVQWDCPQNLQLGSSNTAVSSHGPCCPILAAQAASLSGPSSVLGAIPRNGRPRTPRKRDIVWDPIRFVNLWLQIPQM